MPPTPLTGPLLDLSEARLDALSITVRGVGIDPVSEAVLAHFPPGTEYESRATGAKPRGFFRVPDENPVKLDTATTGDLCLSVMGPNAAVLQRVGLAISEAHPHPLGAWPSRVRVSRIDSRIDIDRPGLWADIEREVLAIRDMPDFRKLPLLFRGDPTRPEDGHTYYLGSQDTVQLVVYEKGKQLRRVKGQEGASPHLVRIEVRVRPADAAAFAMLDACPIAVISRSRPALTLLARFADDLPSFAPSRDAGTRSDLVRSMIAARTQYGPTFWRLARRLGDPVAASAILGLVLGGVARSSDDVLALLARGPTDDDLARLLAACPVTDATEPGEWS